MLKKNAAIGVDEIRKQIEILKSTMTIENVIIWSDGSTGEYLNKHIFANGGKLASHLNVNLLWNYFGNGHGKSICDTQFAQLKTALDRAILGGANKWNNAFEIFNFCVDNLNTLKWKMKGELNDRKYFYRSTSDENEIQFDLNYNTANDTKLYRSVFWNKEGVFFRRHNACACLNCVTKPHNSSVCENIGMIGPWNQYKMKLSRKQLNVKLVQKVDEVDDEDKECCI